MTISKKVLRIVLVLALMIGVSSSIYFANRSYQAAQALEENVEYQVLTAIEAEHPELYVVTVEERNNNVLVYLIAPQEDPYENYTQTVLVHIVAILYNAYPDADSYHVLPVKIIEMDTFEGIGHVGLAQTGFGFTNFAAMTLAGSTQIGMLAEIELLYEAGEIGIYSAKMAQLHVVADPSPRETGHIPPWAEVED